MDPAGRELATSSLRLKPLLPWYVQIPLCSDHSSLNHWDPFYKQSLTLIPPKISNHMHGKVWNEITHPFPNFNSATIEVWRWMSNFIPQFMIDAITYPCWD